MLRSLAALLLVLAPSSAVLALPDHGDYLKDPAESGTVFEYGSAAPSAFDVPSVVDPETGLAAGSLRFDYDTYSREPDGDEAGGAALAGGFFLDAPVVPGFELHWVQTVLATYTSSNAQRTWDLPETNAGVYPDALASSPVYPVESLPSPLLGDPPIPTLSYQDFPGRKFEDGAQSWSAELGLAAISDDATQEIDGMLFREVRIVGTLLWGFEFPGPDDPFGVGDVSPLVPVTWGDPTAEYVAALNEFYDGLGGDDVPSGLYRFVTASQVFVPEPSTLLLVTAGLLVLAARPRSPPAAYRA